MMQFSKIGDVNFSHKLDSPYHLLSKIGFFLKKKADRQLFSSLFQKRKEPKGKVWEEEEDSRS